MTQVIQLRQFDPQRLAVTRKSTCNVVIIGKRGVGKSFLASHLLDIVPRDIIGICSTFEQDVYDEASTFRNSRMKTSLDLVLGAQKHHTREKYEVAHAKIEERLSIIETIARPSLPPELIDVIRKCAKRATVVPPVCATLVLEDDIFWHRNIGLVIPGHQNLLTVGVSQDGPEISPRYRPRVDYVFMFPEYNYWQKRQLHLHWAGKFSNFKKFCVALACLRRYECLVVELTSESDDFSESVFWYKADPPR